MSAERRAYLDQMVPGWFTPDRVARQRKVDMRPIAGVARWFETADLVLAFYRETGRWPSKSSKNREEARLGIWLTAQRQLANPESALSKQGRPLKADRLAYLTDAEPSWLDSAADANFAWRERVLSIAPSLSGGDLTGCPSDDMKWLSLQRAHLPRQGANDTQRERIAFLDTYLPGWRSDPVEARRVANAKLVVVYRKRSGRFPSRYTGQDYRLARWLSGQRDMLSLPSHSESTLRIFAMLDAGAPGWRQGNI